ncbi:MAG: beta-ketoacyl-ACP synthase 3, partial [Pseudomonadota bacterium]
MVARSKIIATGSYLPEKIMGNDQLSQLVDTSDAWIKKRTGIAQRHIAADGQSNADLAIAAATRAMQASNVMAQDIDLIVMATTTPDNTFPANACAVQRGLGVTNGAAFDVQAVCSGFIFALNVVNNMIAMGQARCALVVGSEIYSRILDWSDRTTCVLFGDGAGAVILQASDGDSGIIDTMVGSDGTHYNALYVDGGPASTG